jgi:hypothetical protein
MKEFLMKRAIVSAIAALSVLLFAMTLAGCDLLFPKEEEGEEFPKEEEDDYTEFKSQPPFAQDNDPIPNNFYGEWVDIRTGDTKYITSDNNDQLTRVSGHVAQAGTALLYPMRIANASFSGSIAGLNAANSQSNLLRATGGLGGIQVTIDNLSDTAQKKTATTDSNGEFTVQDIIPGDSYVVTVEDAENVVTPHVNGDNVGTITMIDGEGINFKAGIGSVSSIIHLSVEGYKNYILTDITELYADIEYQVNIVVENTGTIDATAATYQLTLDSGLSLLDGAQTKLLGTIEPGKSKIIGIELECSSSSIQGDYSLKTIGIQIIDPINHKTWNDSVSLKFFRKRVCFYLTAGKNVINGIIVIPDGKAVRFHSDPRDSYNRNYIYLPLLTDGNYTIVFCGASAETETAYYFGVGKSLDYYTHVPKDENFSDAARYEPNNTEETATALAGNEIYAYLHKNDFDYYKFRLTH